MKDVNELLALRRRLGLSDSYLPFSKRIETYVTEASKIQKDTLIGELQKIVDAIQKRKPRSYKRTDYEDFNSIVDALDIKVQNEKLSQDVKYEIVLAKKNGYEAILAIENARNVCDRTEETNRIIAESKARLAECEAFINKPNTAPGYCTNPECDPYEIGSDDGQHSPLLIADSLPIGMCSNLECLEALMESDLDYMHQDGLMALAERDEEGGYVLERFPCMGTTFKCNFQHRCMGRCGNAVLPENKGEDTEGDEASSPTGY